MTSELLHTTDNHTGRLSDLEDDVAEIRTTGNRLDTAVTRLDPSITRLEAAFDDFGTEFARSLLLLLQQVLLNQEAPKADK